MRGTGQTRDNYLPSSASSAIILFHAQWQASTGKPCDRCFSMYVTYARPGRALSPRNVWDSDFDNPHCDLEPLSHTWSKCSEYEAFQMGTPEKLFCGENTSPVYWYWK